jgi:gliding motility-associated-like protein
MPKIIIISLLLLLFSNTNQAQSLKIFSIPQKEQSDTLNFCLDSNIILIARQADSSALPEDTYFEWNYGNGVSGSGINTDSVSNTYNQSGGYFIRLMARTLSQDTLYATKFIRIAFHPSYSQTHSSADTGSICFDGLNNDIVSLDAQFEYPEWKYIFPILKEEAQAIKINLGIAYTSSIEQEVYSPLDKITKATDIDTVSVLMEHSNAQDISIQIICPNGEKTLLKQVGTKKVYMGEPVDNENLDNIPGKLYWYYFTEKQPNFGTMAQEEQQHFYSFTDNADSIYTNEPYFPSGSYLPQESFSNLIGCPYNGNWSIAIVDNNFSDNGYIKAWTLVFDSIPALKSFKNIANNYHWSTLTNAQFLSDSTAISTSAEPLKANSILKFSFTVNDDYGCPSDTSLIVSVKNASFTATPSTGDAELDVNFASTTHWNNAAFDWEFGDGNTSFNQKTAQNKYLDKGIYKVTMTATSEFGCINTDTVSIVVTAPISKIDAPNVISPNGDGINDKMILTYTGLRNARLLIYSKWGERIADLKTIEEIDKGWDGSIGNNGNRMVPPGVYYYVIIAEGKDDKAYNIKGAIQVFYSK